VGAVLRGSARWWGAGRDVPWSVVARHLGLAVATLFVVRVLGAGWSSGFPIFFPDSSSFLEVAGRGPFSGRFWFDERPIGFPLLAWSLGRSVRLVVLAQTALYVAAFATLVVVVVRSLQSKLSAAVAVVGIASVASQPRFALWNTHVLSESLALSLGVLTLAGWWWFAAAPDRRRVMWATAATGVWLITRDSNLVPVVAVVVPTLLVASRWWSAATPPVRRRMVSAAAGLVVVGAYAFVAQDVAGRNRYATINNVGQRVLLDESTTEWFVDRGMPLPDRLVELRGRSSFDDGSAMLVDPKLAEFRSWVDGPGQRVQALSLVVRAGFWLDLLDRDLDQVLASDLGDYDQFGVGDRLPSTWLGLSGPRSVAGLLGWGAVAAVGVVAAMWRRSTRASAVVVAVGLVATALDVYVSHAGDSLEIGRHLVGPIARGTLLLTLGAVLGIDQLATRRAAAPEPTTGASAPRQPWRSRVPAVAAGSLTVVLTALLLAAVFGNELRAQNFDPLYMRVLVERTRAFGGSYYANGVHNKGPLEPLVYEAAAWLGGSRGWWLVLSVFVAIAALVLGAIGAGVARIAGAGRAVAVSVAIGVAFHFTLATGDYPGTLYARQLCVVLLAAAFGFVVVERCWATRSRSTLSALVVGVLVGLAVQTVLSSAVVGMVIMALAVASAVRRHAHVDGAPWRRWPRVPGWMLAGLVTVLVAAPLYYAARGSVQEFWSGWWTYAGYSSSATGRSLAAQLGLGWDRAFAYYQGFPLSLVVLAAFVAATFVRWREYTRRQQQVRLATGAWVVAAWIELAMSQRYSGHYFSVLAAPTWLAFAQLAADAERLVLDRGRRLAVGAAIPLAATVAFVYMGGGTATMEGLARASRFTSLERLAAERQASISPAGRSEQAVLDLVTSPGDPMLAWTMAPWTYLDHQRVSATRFIWKSFLVGEIYLAGAGPQYVLPRTWEWFGDDLDESQPLVYHLDVNLPVDESTPFAEHVDERFELLYTGSTAVIGLRDDVAAQVVSGGEVGAPLPASSGVPSGWTVTTGAARYEPTEAPADVGVALGSGWCRRVDGQIAGAATELEVVVGEDGGATPLGSFRVGGGAVTTTRGGVEAESVPWAPPSSAGVAFAVVVGAESAVLVLDGAIVGALPLTAGVADREGPDVAVVGGQTALELTDVTVAATGPLGTSECR